MFEEADDLILKIEDLDLHSFVYLCRELYKLVKDKHPALYEEIQIDLKRIR